MDLWRWDDTSLGRTSNINQIVDPSITVTKDYIFVTAGWSESIADEKCLCRFHNNQRQTMIKIDKSKLVPYEKWPENYAQDDEILFISVTAPLKLSYQVGEKLDLTGGFLTVHYYDGSSEKVSLEDPEVSISEPDKKNNYSAKFEAPDMEKAEMKLLRVTYKTFADNFTITVG